MTDWHDVVGAALLATSIVATAWCLIVWRRPAGQHSPRWLAAEDNRLSPLDEADTVRLAYTHSFEDTGDILRQLGYARR